MTVLAAGVGNDVVGWILLALTIALVNSSSGLTAFYVILLVIAWTLLLFLGVKPAYAWLARKSSMESGPTDSMMTLTILLVLVSAFYTEIIGVHPIFGAFLVGLIIPHENNYAVNLTEKIEDLVSVLFLPLYFASSGLKTDIGLLNDGKAWGYTIAIIVCATVSKVSGSMIAARLNGFLWRESLTVGTLMSCKGLVELIVLNVGLSAGILSQKLFTMFVIMALVTTFMTTPLVMWFYPPWYQEKVTKWRSGECDWDGNKLEKEKDESLQHRDDELEKVVMVVSRIEGVAALLKFTHFISYSNIGLHVLRIMEMTDRLSQIIKVSESEDLLQQDSLLSIFKTMTRIVGVKLSYALHVLAIHEYANVVEEQSRDLNADLVVAPWLPSTDSDWHDNDFVLTLLEQRIVNLAVLLEHNDAATPPLASRRRTVSMGSILSRSRSTTEGINQVRSSAKEASSTSEKIHIYFPLFGFGPDERLGLLLLTRILENENVTASVRLFRHSPDEHQHSSLDAGKSSVQFAIHEHSEVSRPTTGRSDTEITTGPPNLDSEVADLDILMPKLPNLDYQIINHSSPLYASIEMSGTLAKRYSTSSITTLLPRFVHAYTRFQLQSIDKHALCGGNSLPPVTGRGELVDLFASLKDQPNGGIIVVQARGQV